MSKKGDLHRAWQRAYRDAYPEITAAAAQKNADEIWRLENDNHKTLDALQAAINSKISECEARTLHRRSQYGLFFSKAAEGRKTDGAEPSCSKQPESSAPKTKSVTTVAIGGEDPDEDPDDPQEGHSSGNTGFNRPATQKPKNTPAQDKIRTELELLHTQKTALVKARDAFYDETATAKIRKIDQEIQRKEQELKTIRKNAEYQKAFRAKQKESLTKLIAANPDVQIPTKSQEEPGRPRFEEDDALIESIVDLVLLNSAADGRRRTEMIRAYRTLDDLHDAVQEKGFEISRSGLYLRLLPRNSRSREGKRHIKTAPVKLCRAQTSEHKSHPDGAFCVATIRYVESLASVLGPDQAIFLSQDDKAKVPIGMTAANKQAPLMMHLEYRVQLPDHDWVIAPKHKLTPSVYKTVEIKKGFMGSPDAVSYSGPTYIAIRSLKHSPSNANSHYEDLNTLLDLDAFKDFVRNSIGEVKPVLIISSDGGPDENPRYPKVISFAIQNFREHNLDAVFVVTNAPGRSAFNRVERTMAPLSAQLAGLILPASSFGTHLDKNGNTVDENLELRNFTAAGEALAEVWSSLEIDGHVVQAEFKKPGTQPEVPPAADPLWYSIHVQESQYALQVVKCRDPSCCKPTRSNLMEVLPSRFLPPPCPLLQTTGGLVIPKATEVNTAHLFQPLFLRLAQKIPIPVPQEWKKVPYDTYCPSLSIEVISSRMCSTCGQYFASKKAAETHAKCVHFLKKKATGTKEKSPKIRPVRVSARRRGTEVLCHVPSGSVDTVECEWHEEGDLDLRDVPVVAEVTEAAIIRPAAEWAVSAFTLDED